VLPWRARPGERPDPYRVWLAEIMLQQTTVVTVGPYYAKFLARWPTVEALAAAPLDSVLGAWAGLGYYARARNLHRCAQAVVAEQGGRFPDTEEGLLALPGIGLYTAAAVAAIAFGRRAVVVDGNVERVMARLFAIASPLPRAKPEFYAAAERLTPDRRAGDYAQAVMDLGATICVSRGPKCLLCPWNKDCAAHAAGNPERYPVKSPKAERPTRRGVAFVLMKEDAVWLRRRPENGLLGGMLEAPSTPWQDKVWTRATARAHVPAQAEWTALPGIVEHGFTHFAIEFTVWVARAATCQKGTDKEGAWCRIADFDRLALPTMTRKVLEAALASQPPRQSARERARPRIMPK
jgi:A/G-specific adenine glycosylase